MQFMEHLKSETSMVQLLNLIKSNLKINPIGQFAWIENT